MKWKLNPSENRYEGKPRINQKFLWFPLTISFERRWLEVARWEERWHYWDYSEQAGELFDGAYIPKQFLPLE